MSETRGPANWCSAAEVSIDRTCGVCGAKATTTTIAKWFIDEDPQWDRCDDHHPYNDDQRVTEREMSQANAIIVNGRDHTTSQAMLDYGALLSIAGKADARLYTVTYSDRRKPGEDQRSGTLAPGEAVAVRNGMIFAVADTSGA